MTTGATLREKASNLMAWLHLGLAFLLMASMTFPDAWLLKVFFAWSVTWLFDWLLSKRYLHLHFSWKNAALYTLGLLFLLMLSSLLYSDNLDYAGRLLERRLAFVIVPIMSCFGFNDKYRLKDLLLAFVVGCMLSLLCTMLLPCLEFLFDIEKRYLYRKSGVDQFIRIAMDFKHRSYFGVMQLMSLLSLWYLRSNLISHWSKQHFHGIFWTYFVLVTLHLALMKGRAAILAALILLVFVACKQLKHHKKWAVTLLILFFGSAYMVWEYHPRFQNLHIDQLQSQHLTLEQKDLRWGIWQSSMEVLFEDGHWLSGVGSGDLKDVLDQKYADKEFDIVQRHAHNTLLNTWIECGLPAVIMMLFIMIWPLCRVARQHRFFLWSMAVPLYILLMTEALTQSIIGVLLWTFFLLLAAALDKDNKPMQEDPKRANLTQIEHSALPVDPYKYSLRFAQVMLCVTLCLWAAFCLLDREYHPRQPRTYAIKRIKASEIQRHLPAPYPAILQGCKAYRVDASSKGMLAENAKAFLFSSDLYLPSADYKSFSIWCYLSEDFNGDFAGIQTFIYQDSTFSYFQTPYDMQRKGTWQQLHMATHNKSNYAPYSFMIRQNDAENFKDLQGYALFALPQFSR